MPNKHAQSSDFSTQKLSFAHMYFMTGAVLMIAVFLALPKLSAGL
jgi:hypothetical protein